LWAVDAGQGMQQVLSRTSTANLDVSNKLVGLLSCRRPLGRVFLPFRPDRLVAVRSKCSLSDSPSQ